MFIEVVDDFANAAYRAGHREDPVRFRRQYVTAQSDRPVYRINGNRSRM